MMHRSWFGITATLLLGSACTIQNYYPAPASASSPAMTPTFVSESRRAPEAPPPVVAGSVDTAPAVTAPVDTVPVVTMSPLPSSARGHILYSQLTVQGSIISGTGPLLAMNPDAPANPATVQALSSCDYRINSGLVGGYDTNARQFWSLNLRSGATSTFVTNLPIDGLTSDGRIVSRCAGGLDEAFALCTYDATGGGRTVVATEPGTYGEATFVAGAGGTRVLGDYANLTKAPFVFDLSTGKRHELAQLRRTANGYATRPIISATGALAAHCFVQEKRNSLVIAKLAGGRDQMIDLGKLKRCECKFSPDDTTLACGILPSKPGSSGKPDQLITIDLATGKQTLLSSTMLIAEFAFSPDGRELVYAAERTAGSDEYWLGIISTTGGTTRYLVPWSAAQALVAWIGNN